MLPQLIFKSFWPSSSTSVSIYVLLITQGSTVVSILFFLALSKVKINDASKVNGQFKVVKTMEYQIHKSLEQKTCLSINKFIYDHLRNLYIAYVGMTYIILDFLLIKCTDHEYRMVKFNMEVLSHIIIYYFSQLL